MGLRKVPNTPDGGIYPPKPAPPPPPPPPRYGTPFRCADFSLSHDVSEIQALRDKLREKESEVFRLKAEVAALAEQNERLKARVSTCDAHLGTTKE